MAQQASRTQPEATESGTIATVTDDQSGLDVAVLDTIQAVDKQQWNDVVERSDLGTVFHRYEWLQAIEDGLGYAPRHLVVEKDTNPIGLAPHFIVDLPKTPFRRLTSIYPGFGGPVLTTDVSDSLSVVIDTIPELCTGRTIVHEIRACNTNYLRYNDFMESNGYRSTQMGGRFLLELSKGYDEIFDGMTSSKRRAIRRGRENDVEIVEEPITRENLARFHEQYQRVMDRVGAETYPMSFFEQLVGMESRLLLVTLRIEGEYAGGMIELLNDEQDALHGFFAGVPSEYFEYHASELLYDYVIRWAIDNGYETYDFGGSGSDFQDGAFAFKEEFGGQLVPNLYWERGDGVTWDLVRMGRSLYWRYGE